MKIQRFTPVQRIFHLLLVLSFLFQAVTGVSRLYIESAWGRSLANWFGGYEGSLILHKWVGLFMIALFLLHLLYLLATIKGRYFSGPDTLLPRPKDFGDFFKHVGWFFGLNKPPRFDRWGYWEKFDYWAVFWGMVIIGTTGLLLYNPVLSSRYIPGWGLNIVLWVHRIEAILAIGHVFIIHFFIAHIRPHSFPMDTAMFDGGVDVDKAEHERPAWIQRLKSKAPLSQFATSPASGTAKAIYFVFGYAVVVSGVLLVILGLINAPHITW